jgi:pilus assembly protein CpaE
VQAHTAAQSVPILVLTGTDDGTLAVCALERGAQDYLVKGQFDGNRLMNAMRYAVARKESQIAAAQRAPGAVHDQVFGVVGAKGGCGATTVACHLARELTVQTNQSVLLADMDLVCGSVGFLMKTTSSYTVMSAAENSDRLDLNLWRNLVSSGTPNLDVLAAPETLAVPNAAGVDQLARIIRFARQNYDRIVVDMGRGMTEFTLSLMYDIDHTHIVTTPEVMALSRATGIVSALVANGYPYDRLRLIVNRMPARPRLSLKDIEDALKLPVYAVFPNGAEELEESYIKDRLAPRNGVLGRQFAAFASKVANLQEPEGKKKKFSLFG